MSSKDSGTADPGRRWTANGVVVGRIAGVPISVAPSWVLSVVIIGALGVPVIAQVVPGTGPFVAVAVSVLLGLLLGASVLAHELGHCLAARLLGMNVVGVRLYLLGGVSELQRVPRSPREEAVIAAAGPAVSAVLAGLSWLVVQLTEPGTVTWLLVMLLALSNLVVAVFNVLPALPLDGGRVLRAAVWVLTGNRRTGTTVAVIGGYLISLLLVGYAVALLIGDGADALLPAGIAVAMALFVAVGAAAERGRRARSTWPAGLPLTALARPVVQLPGETPIALALQAAGGRAVLVIGPDGVTRGVLDSRAAQDLVLRAPGAPTSLASIHLPPESIVLPDDAPAAVVGRARRAGSAAFLLIDEAGRPAGLLHREDILAAAARRPARWWELAHSAPAAAQPLHQDPTGNRQPDQRQPDQRQPDQRQPDQHREKHV
ncbi:M50 family metallopeptidase [Nakamurella sp. GG22]